MLHIPSQEAKCDPTGLQTQNRPTLPHMSQKPTWDSPSFHCFNYPVINCWEEEFVCGSVFALKWGSTHTHTEKKSPGADTSSSDTQPWWFMANEACSFKKRHYRNTQLQAAVTEHTLYALLVPRLNYKTGPVPPTDLVTIPKIVTLFLFLSNMHSIFYQVNSS